MMVEGLSYGGYGGGGAGYYPKGVSPDYMDQVYEEADRIQDNIQKSIGRTANTYLGLDANEVHGTLDSIQGAMKYVPKLVGIAVVFLIYRYIRG